MSAPLLAPSARVKASSAAQLWLVICAQLEQCCSAQFHARVVRLNAALCVFAALLAGCQGARRGQPLGLARAHGLKKGVMHEVRGGLHLVRRCLARVKCVLQQQYSSNGRKCELKQKKHSSSSFRTYKLRINAGGGAEMAFMRGRTIGCCRVRTGRRAPRRGLLHSRAAPPQLGVGI